MGSTNPTASERVDAHWLHRFTQQTFEKCGMSVADAELLADQLVWADLRGMSSLGATNVPGLWSATRS